METKLFSDSFLLKLQKVGLNNLAALQTECSNDINRAYHLRNNGTISYLPKGKDCILAEAGTWARQNRIEARLHKTIKQLFNDYSIECTAQDIERAGNMLKAICDDSNETSLHFDIVKGRDIARYYSESCYAEGCGTLNNSCMRDCDSDYFDIYCDNKKYVSMVVLLDSNDKLHGRAILWEYDGNKYLDRIYGSDATIEKFKFYARDNDIKYKREQSYTSNDYNINGESIALRLRIRGMSIDTDGKFPYIDTFKYLHSDGVSSYSTRDQIAICNNTDGTADGLNNNIIECHGCNNDIDEDECNHVGYYTYCNDCASYDELADKSILNEDAVQARYRGRSVWTSVNNSDIVEVNGNYYHNESDEIIYLDSENKYALIDEVTYCDYNEQYYLSDDCVHIDIDGFCGNVHQDNVEDVYTENNYTQVDGEWINKDDIEEEDPEVSEPEPATTLYGQIIHKGYIPFNSYGCNDKQVSIEFNLTPQRIMFVHGCVEYRLLTGKRNGKYILRNGNKYYLKKMKFTQLRHLIAA